MLTGQSPLIVTPLTEEKNVDSPSSSSSSSSTSSLSLINSKIIIKGTKLFFLDSFPWDIISLSDLTDFFKKHPGIKSIYLTRNLNHLPKEKIASLITVLPPKINQLVLNETTLSSEQLTQLITALKSKETIIHLSINNKPSLTDTHAQELASLISSHLISFQLQNHHRSPHYNNSNPDIIVALLQAMANSIKFEEISFHHCSLNAAAWQALASILSRKNSPLRSLTLKSCGLNDATFAFIASSMKENGSLVQLNFDNFEADYIYDHPSSEELDNNITEEGLGHIGIMLEKNNIQALSLNYCKIKKTQALLIALCKSKTLKRLELKKALSDRFDDVALFTLSGKSNNIAPLTWYLGNHPRLLHLDLTGCGLTSIDSSTLFKTIAAGNSFIAFLNLSNNIKLDFTSLNHMLSSNKTIRELILRECLYVDQIKPMLETLSANENSNVTTLDVSSSRLNDEIITALITLLEKGKIKTLNLSDCVISNDELMRLAIYLEKHTSLASIDLSSIQSSHDHCYNAEEIGLTIIRFRESLRKNENIIELKLPLASDPRSHAAQEINTINQLLKRNRERCQVTAASVIFRHGTAVVSKESKDAISAVVPYILSFIDSTHLPALGVPLATEYLRTISFFKAERTPSEKMSHALSKLYALCQATDIYHSHFEMRDPAISSGSTAKPATSHRMLLAALQPHDDDSASSGAMGIEENIFDQLLSAIAESKEDCIKTILSDLTRIIENSFKDKDPAKITFAKVLIRYLLESSPELVERGQFIGFKPKLI